MAEAGYRGDLNLPGPRNMAPLRTAKARWLLWGPALVLASALGLAIIHVCGLLPGGPLLGLRLGGAMQCAPSCICRQWQKQRVTVTSELLQAWDKRTAAMGQLTANNTPDAEHLFDRIAAELAPFQRWWQYETTFPLCCMAVLLGCVAWHPRAAAVRWHVQRVHLSAFTIPCLCFPNRPPALLR